jgi:hypothetical protein
VPPRLLFMLILPDLCLLDITRSLHTRLFITNFLLLEYILLESGEEILLNRANTLARRIVFVPMHALARMLVPIPSPPKSPRTDCRPQKVRSLQDSNDQSSCAESVVSDLHCTPHLPIKLVMKGS